MTSTEDRRRILLSLLSIDRPLETILAEVATLPWDGDDELVTLRATHVVDVLKLFQRGECGSADVERWANAIEGREDVGLEGETAPLVKQAVFDLANPALQGAITPEVAARWIARLSGALT